MYDLFKNLFRGYRVRLKKETRQKFRFYQEDKKSFLQTLREELGGQTYQTAVAADRHDFRSGQNILREYFVQGLLFGIAAGTECYKDADPSALYKMYSGQTLGYCFGGIQNKESLNESREYERLSAALCKELSVRQYDTFCMLNEINRTIVRLLHWEYFSDGIKKGMLLGSQAIGLIGQM